jgi:hypothetical protein
MLRKLLATRSATIAMEYAIIGGLVIVVVLSAFEEYGIALQINMKRSACHISGGTWSEPNGPCT